MKFDYTAGETVFKNLELPVPCDLREHDIDGLEKKIVNSLGLLDHDGRVDFCRKLGYYLFLNQKANKRNPYMVGKKEDGVPNLKSILWDLPTRRVVVERYVGNPIYPGVIGPVLALLTIGAGYVAGNIPGALAAGYLNYCFWGLMDKGFDRLIKRKVKQADNIFDFLVEDFRRGYWDREKVDILGI